MSVVSRVPEAVAPRAEVTHRSIQLADSRRAGLAIDWRQRHARALLAGDLIVLALAVAFWLDRVDGDLWFGATRVVGATLHPLSLVYALSGSAMISATLRIPKP